MQYVFIDQSQALLIEGENEADAKLNLVLHVLDCVDGQGLDDVRHWLRVGLEDKSLTFRKIDGRVVRSATPLSDAIRRTAEREGIPVEKVVSCLRDEDAMGLPVLGETTRAPVDPKKQTW